MRSSFLMTEFLVNSYHLPDSALNGCGFAVDCLDGDVPVDHHHEAELGKPEFTNLVQFGRIHDTCMLNENSYFYDARKLKMILD